MAQIDTENQFMSPSALAGGKCKASFQTEGINTLWEGKRPYVGQIRPLHSQLCCLILTSRG